MPAVLEVLLAGAAIAALVLVRGLWMRAQVRKAVCCIVLPAAEIVGISEVGLFADCGSVRAAFRASLCDRYFLVRYRCHGESAREFWIAAVFYPLVGWLRRVQVVNG